MNEVIRAALSDPLLLFGGAILLLLIFSAFFSGSETALTAVSRARMHAREKAGDKAASSVLRLTDMREKLIGALLLGNNLVNILASSLATSLFLSLFGEQGVAIATLVMTALVLIFSEVLPKTLAITDPERFALGVARPVSFIVAIFGPVTAAVQIIIRLVLRLFGRSIESDRAVLSAHEEIRGQLDLLHREGSVGKGDRDRLGGLLDLHELEVSDVMVHRTKMAMIDIDLPADAIVREVLASPYSRLPVFKDTSDNIIGVIHVKDLLRQINAQGSSLDKLDIKAIASTPWFVPDTTGLQAQLNAFLKRKAHIALVVDEYGEVQGLITLEDILEEIVGDIADEHDVVVEGVRPAPDGALVVEGTVPIRDLNRAFDWSLPDDEATTLAGLVIHEARQIPQPGQAFTFHGFRFEVVRRQRNRLTLIKVTPIDDTAHKPLVASE